MAPLTFIYAKCTMGLGACNWFVHSIISLDEFVIVYTLAITTACTDASTPTDEPSYYDNN